MKPNRKESGVSVWPNMVHFCQQMTPRENACVIEKGNTHYYGYKTQNKQCGIESELNSFAMWKIYGYHRSCSSEYK